MGQTEPSPRRWLVTVLCLGVFVNMLGALALSPFLPVVAEDLGVGIALLGQVPAAMSFLAALLGLVIGPLAEHFGYRRTMLLGLFAVVVSSLATGLAPTFPLLILMTLVGAIGRAGVLPVAQAIVATRFTDDAARRVAFSRLQSGQAAASILGIPALTIIAALLHWRSAFFVLGGLAIGVWLVLWRLLPSEGERAVGPVRMRQVLGAYGPLLRHRPSLALLGATLLGLAAGWAVVIYMAAFYMQRHGFTTQDVGWVFLVIGLAMFLGQSAAGGRLGASPWPLVIASRPLCGVFLGAALLLPISGSASVGLVVVALALHGVNSVGTVVLMNEVTPAGRATTMTVNGSATNLGTALGGSVGGLALAIGEYPALGLCSAALSVSAGVLVWWSRRSMRSPATLGDPVPA